jgi:hypothetical protein
MGHVLERAKVDALVVAELARRHVAVVLHDLAEVLGREILSAIEQVKTKGQFGAASPVRVEDSVSRRRR